MNILFRLVALLVGSLPAPVDTARAKKVLVVDFSFLGDVVMTSVVHHAVRRQIPGAAVHVFGFAMVKAILPLVPAIDVLHEAPRNGRLRQIAAALRLRRERFDLAIHVNTGLWVNFLVWLSGARVRAGYDFGGRGCFHNVRVPIATRTVKAKLRSQECADLLASAFGWKVEGRVPILKVPPEAVGSMNAKLRRWGVAPGDILVGIHTSSRQDRDIRCWEEAKFAELANTLIERHGAKIVFTDVRTDRPFVEPILAGITRKEFIVDAMGETDIPELCALLRRMNVLVTINTAPMHFAIGVQAPLVAILGYAPAYLYFPPEMDIYQWVEDPALAAYDVHRIVQAFPARVREIGVREVLEKVEYLLRTHPRHQPTDAP